MANEYAVYKTLEDGTNQWVKNEMPLVFGTENEAIKWDYPDACAIATYLTNTEQIEFKVGRPGDRQPK